MTSIYNSGISLPGSAPRAATGMRPGERAGVLSRLDTPLLLAVLALVTLGLVMVTSASMPMADRMMGNPWHYFTRQSIYLLLALVAAFLTLQLPLRLWERSGYVLMGLALLMLLLVLVPGVGKTVNGSTRWIDLGLFQLQVSEPARLFLLIYLAGYLVRQHAELRVGIGAFLRPMLVLSLAVSLLLMQPDFGAAAVLVAAALIMFYLAGVRLGYFVLLFSGSLAAMLFLVWSSPYRMARFTGFLNPWADPFNSGFQLTQSLMAIGSGQWLGAGLGASMQKMFYLPEAHTDFLFAIIAEELGLVGSVTIIALYAVVVWRMLVIAGEAATAGRWFAAYLVYGLGAWMGLQVFVNIGVNMGLLPTKGLTLPLMSYGGSSLLVMAVVVAIVLRVAIEVRAPGARGGVA